MYDDPTEEIGVSLPTSVNERASDTTNKITGPSFIDKGPSIDWSTDYNLYNCFKMWKQRCELLPGRWRKLNKKSNASIYYTGRGNTEPNFKQLGHVRRWAKKAGKLLDETRTFCQATLKWVNSNVGDSQPPTRTLSLQEFIAKLRIRAKQAYYTIQHNDPFMRDFPVLGMNSDLLRKDCFKVGNAFTFKEVRDMAKSAESADNQLQLINTPSVLDQCS